MTENIKKFMAANKKYAEDFGKKGDLAVQPARKLMVLTCMDSRLEPMKFLGLNLGDAHIIRNAGGRASEDAIRSLVVSSTQLGTNELLIIHHTDCGLEMVTQEMMASQLKEKLNTTEGEFVNWLCITDKIDSVKTDAIRIRNHPLVSKEIKISGYLYDVRSGLLEEVIKI
jgi:carbonic anhydrase